MIFTHEELNKQWRQRVNHVDRCWWFDHPKSDTPEKFRLIENVAECPVTWMRKEENTFPASEWDKGSDVLLVLKKRKNKIVFHYDSKQERVSYFAEDHADLLRDHNMLDFKTYWDEGVRRLSDFECEAILIDPSSEELESLKCLDILLSGPVRVPETAKPKKKGADKVERGERAESTDEAESI